ncbi:UV DNA damage repair endonuclease UvsE [Clostridium paridis]|uniref:UV DNA damage repair endonuclease UvsE n=1 Tax=Clostridium paridis TaxID=2803863 RepID=A0A937K521_9CLOT|nr:UV DNA damage repair endonuclease UvsE [Clostridium paridis]MBL4932519.1 UV DNA damage repair endonuclease UvsE [Clostridium paridis]
MNIGYACISLTTNARTNRKLLLKNYSNDALRLIIKENLSDLMKILINNKKNKIFLYRISSDIIPLASHEINTFPWQEVFKDELLEIGTYIKENNMRVSMHPGQYTVINSPKEEVIKNSIAELEYHTDFLNALGVDYTNKIVLHIGGVYGDKTSAKERFISNFRSLSDSTKQRLVIENDEKNFSLEDVLDISYKIEVPVIYDNLHNYCYGSNNLTHKEIYKLVSKTWKCKDGNMKVHYSEQDKNKKKGSHSQTINLKLFLDYFNEVKEFNPDIMLEVKDKDISSIKIINALNELSGIPASKSLIYDEWAKYKYLIMAYNYDFYKECKNIIKNNSGIVELYNKIDSCTQNPLLDGNLVNTLEHIWGYFKTSATSQEKKHFFKLLSEKNLIKCKDYLYKLSYKYHEDYLLNSYFFKEL